MDMDLEVSQLFDFDIVAFSNDDPDIRVVTIRNDLELEAFVLDYIGANPMQTICYNRDPETTSMCPYVRILTSEIETDMASNFKLQSFLSRLKVSCIVPNCKRAVAIGLTSPSNPTSFPLTMPTHFYQTSVPVLELGINGVLDVACLTPLGAFSGQRLCDIPGVVLPVYLPPHVQSLILSFCREPTAEVIASGINQLWRRFDRAVYPLFVQTASLLVVTGPSFFNAFSVPSVILAATSPFLARRA